MAAIANVETALAPRDSQDIVLHDIKSRAVLGGGFEDRPQRRRDVGFATDPPVEEDGFEPSVPLPRKVLLGVANRRRRHERRSHLQVQVRDGNACLDWLPTTFPFAEGPRVRIRLPPAASPLRTAGEGARPELGQTFKLTPDRFSA
jgi:hypothetical protein